MNKLSILALYAASIALLHHLFHLYLQPALNNTYADFFNSLPSYFAGSTSSVTIYVFVITFIGGSLLLKYG